MMNDSFAEQSRSDQRFEKKKSQRSERPKPKPKPTKELFYFFQCHRSEWTLINSTAVSAIEQEK